MTGAEGFVWVAGSLEIIQKYLSEFLVVEFGGFVEIRRSVHDLLQGGHWFVGDAAGNDEPKMVHVRADIQGRSVESDPVMHAHADSGDF